MFLVVQSYRTSAGGPGCLGSLDRKTSLIATTLGGEFVQFPAVSMFFGGAVNKSRQIPGFAGFMDPFLGSDLLYITLKGA